MLLLSCVQGKLEAKPMGDAIKVLEQAWAIAYREIGKEGDEVATIDMITGALRRTLSKWLVLFTSCRPCAVLCCTAKQRLPGQSSSQQPQKPTVEQYPQGVTVPSCVLCCAGNASVFKAGIEKNMQQQRLYQDQAAAVEAAKKAGIMGKAKNVFGTTTGGLLGSKASSGGGAPLPPNGVGECC